MFGEISRGRMLALLALLACPVAAWAEPIYPMSFLSVGFDADALNGRYGQPFQYASGTLRHVGPVLDETQAGPANGLNDLGLVAGEYATLGGGQHAWVDARGDIRMLGTIRGWETWAVSTAIKRHGQVAGWSTDETGDMVPFIYSDGELRNLNRIVEEADGWTLVEAYDIIDARQILGKACRQDECLSVRLDLVSAVPEPGSYALLAAGLVLLAGWRSSDRRDSLRFS